MGEKLSATETEGTLAAGETLEAEIYSGGASDDIFVLIDDGAGGDPAGYSITADVLDDDSGEYMFYSQEGDAGTPVTARSWTDPAVPDEVRYTLTNQSGAPADYRLRVISAR